MLFATLISFWLSKQRIWSLSCSKFSWNRKKIKRVSLEFISYNLVWSYVRKKVFFTVGLNFSAERDVFSLWRLLFFVITVLFLVKMEKSYRGCRLQPWNAYWKASDTPFIFKIKPFFFLHIFHINKLYAYLNCFKLHFIYQSFQTEREEMRCDKLLCESTVTISHELKQNMQLILNCVPVFLKSEKQMLFIVLQPDFFFSEIYCGNVWSSFDPCYN